MAGGEVGAFCPILWEANHGRTNKDGTPLFESGLLIQGVCESPQDCDRCGLLQNARTQMYGQNVTTLWVCPDCSGESMKRAKADDVAASLPGYFTEGYCQHPQCARPNGDQSDQEARYSILLQLLTVAGATIP